MNRIKFEYCVKHEEQTIVEDKCTLFVLKRERDVYDDCVARNVDPNEEDKGKQIIANVGNQIERIALAKLVESGDSYTIDSLDEQKNPFDGEYKLLIRFYVKNAEEK